MKEFYLKDFDKLLLSDNDFWKIEESISQQLKCINQNSNIQTLYSKNGEGKLMSESYLDFCYVQDVEQTIFKKFLPDLLRNFNNQDKSCVYDFCYPRDNANYNENSKSEYSCVSNINHFRINHIRIEFDPGYGKKGHSEFWNYLANQLSVIK